MNVLLHCLLISLIYGLLYTIAQYYGKFEKKLRRKRSRLALDKEAFSIWVALSNFKATEIEFEHCDMPWFVDKYLELGIIKLKRETDDKKVYSLEWRLRTLEDIYSDAVSE